MVKPYDAKLAINDLVGAFSLSHGVKRSIEHTDERLFVVSEKHSYEMLIMIRDIEITMNALRAIFEKEHWDAIERRIEKEEQE